MTGTANTPRNVIFNADCIQPPPPDGQQAACMDAAAEREGGGMSRPQLPGEQGKDFAMRWIVTADYWGNCLGLGEDADGVPARGAPEQADALPMEFRLCDARDNVVFEGRCGDIDADWWHGYEPLIATGNTFRCRRG